jgi:hypothetical protein
MIEKYNRDMAEIDMAIVRLRAANGAGSDGNKPEVVEVPIKPGQYKGMATSPALELYLRERGGGPIDIHKIAADLELAGVPIAQQKDRYIRNLRIVVSNNRNLRYIGADKSKIELANRMR